MKNDFNLVDVPSELDKALRNQDKATRTIRLSQLSNTFVADSFVAALTGFAQEGKDPITLIVNDGCTGGIEAAAKLLLAIREAQAQGVPVNAVAYGMVSTVGALMLATSDQRTVTDRTYLFADPEFMENFGKTASYSLKGRDEEAEQVLRLLTSRRLSSLFTGEAGVGKTAIATAMAQRINDEEKKINDVLRETIAVLSAHGFGNKETPWVSAETLAKNGFVQEVVPVKKAPSAPKPSL